MPRVRRLFQPSGRLSSAPPDKAASTASVNNSPQRRPARRLKKPPDRSPCLQPGIVRNRGYLSVAPAASPPSPPLAPRFQNNAHRAVPLVSRSDTVVNESRSIVKRSDAIVSRSEGIVRRLDAVVRKSRGIMSRSDAIARKSLCLVTPFSGSCHAGSGHCHLVNRLCHLASAHCH